MASIKKNFAYNIMLNLSKVIFPLVTAPYIARVLEPDGVGLFNFANTYANYFALFAVLGIPTYGIRVVAKKREKLENLQDLVSEMMSISAIATLIMTIAFLLTIFFIPQLTENKQLFLVAGFVLYLAPFKIDWYYSGLERFGYITMRVLIIRIVSIVAMFVFVKNKTDLIIYMIICVVGSIGGDLWNYLMLLRDGIKPQFKITGLKPHLFPLFILFFSAITVSIYTLLDTLMLGFMTDYDQVGYYNSASHIAKAFLSIVTSLSVVAIPRISYYMEKKDYVAINRLINKSFSIVSFLAFPITIGLICISPVFVPLFFGYSFVGSIIPLMIMSGVIVAIGFNNLTGVQILIGMGFDKLFLRCVLIGTIVNFMLNLMLLPRLGACGAAVSSVIAETFILFVTLYSVRKSAKVSFHGIKNDLLKSLGGSLLFIPISLGIGQFFQGWRFVFVDLFLCGISYVFLQYLWNNSSCKEIIALITNKFDKR